MREPSILEPTSPPEFPKPFGRYQLLELLATGGMAYVYRARLASDSQAQKELVIKQILPNLTHNREFIDMFIDEARISMPLSHGNIVQVFEFGQVGSDYFLVMEHVRGKNLHELMQRVWQQQKTIPVSIALFICSEIAKGLDYAHRFCDSVQHIAGIIHRDVSPQNILVGYRGEVKLTDFGIAKARQRLRTTAHGIIRGKACYLSPEQAECLEMDGRSDLFSLGVVLYELLTGKKIFEGKSEIETLKNIMETCPPSPSEFRTELDSTVDQVLLQALEKKPEHRFQTMGAFHLALNRALYGIDPNFTSSGLADWMERSFALEKKQEETRSDPSPVYEDTAKLHSKSLSTDELLALGTKSLGRPIPGKKMVPRLGWFSLALLAIAIGMIFGFWLWEPGSRNEGRSVPTLPKWQPVALETKTDPKAQEVNQPLKATPKEPEANKTIQPYGFLDLNSRPWAYVEIDGKRIDKETPLFGIRVRTGMRRLRFFNPELKLEKEMTVKVQPQQTQTVTVKLAEP